MEDLDALIQKLSADFGVETSTQNLEQFLGALQEQVKNLLLHDMEKLKWILYRIDVPEKLFNRALEEKGVDSIAAALTQLIYSRQLEKLKTRGNSPAKDFLDM